MKKIQFKILITTICDEGNDGFLGGGGAPIIFLADMGVAGQIILRNTGLDCLNLWVSQSHYTLSHTCSLHKVQVTCDVRNTHHPFQVSIQKIAIGPTFPAKTNCEMDLTATIRGFPGTLINETIIHYMNTVPWYRQPYRFVSFKMVQNNYAMLSPKITPIPRLFP